MTSRSAWAAWLASVLLGLAVWMVPGTALAQGLPSLFGADKMDQRLLNLARTCAVSLSSQGELIAQATPVGDGASGGDGGGAEVDLSGPLPDTPGDALDALRERLDLPTLDEFSAAVRDGNARRTAEASEAARTEAQAREDEPLTANEALEQTDDDIDAFLQRDALGFDTDTFAHIRGLVVAVVQSTRSTLSEFAGSRFIDKLKMSAPLQLIVILVLIFLILDRRARHLRRELWDMVPPLSSPTWDNLLDSALRVLARTLPVALLLIPIYFPLTGIFPEAVWLAALTRLLWLLLAYRAAAALGHEALIGETFGFVVKPVRLAAWWRFGLRVWFVLMVAHDMVDIVGLRPDVSALIAFTIKVFAAIYVLRLFALRDELVLLVPDIPDSGLYATLRRFLLTYVHLLLALSVLLIVLWAAGFSTAASFILVRTYSLIGLMLVSLWVYRRTQAFLREMIQRQETPEGEPIDIERHRTLRSVERSVLFVGAVAMVWAVLYLLGVWPLIVRLASVPIIEIGDPGIRISVFVVAKAVMVFVLFVLVSRVLRAGFNEKVYPRFEVEVGVGYAINTTVHYFLFVLGIMLALGSLGIDLSGVAIFASALGIGIGFGLQDIVSNLISGFILLFGRSVKKGDYVTVNDSFGRVDAVGARSVTITTPDNFELVIPSSELVSNSIINWTLTSPYIRVSLPVGVHYTSDVRKVREVLRDAALRHPKVLRRPAPEVWLEEFGDNSVNFSVLVYVDLRRTNQRRIKGELNFHVWDSLQEAGIEIPYPQRDLHLRTGFEPLLERYLEARRPRDDHDDDASDENKALTSDDEASTDDTRGLPPSVDRALHPKPEPRPPTAKKKKPRGKSRS